MQTDPETRMTMNFNRETLGFDNKPFEFDENLMRQKEQEIRLKSAIVNKHK